MEAHKKAAAAHSPHEAAHKAKVLAARRKRPSVDAGRQDGAPSAPAPVTPATPVGVKSSKETSRKGSVDAAKVVPHGATHGRGRRKSSAADVPVVQKPPKLRKEEAQPPATPATPEKGSAKATPKSVTPGHDREAGRRPSLAAQEAAQPSPAGAEPEQAPDAAAPPPTARVLPKLSKEGPTPKEARVSHARGSIVEPTATKTKSEYGVTRTRAATATAGPRKAFLFRDPPLPKEAHVAVGLLVLATITVALFLAYDVFVQSFADQPIDRNGTTLVATPVPTTPLPTPVFMP